MMPQKGNSLKAFFLYWLTLKLIPEELLYALQVVSLTSYIFKIHMNTICSSGELYILSTSIPSTEETSGKVYRIVDPGRYVNIANMISV